MTAIAPTPESLVMLEKIRGLTEENRQLWAMIERITLDAAKDRQRIAKLEAQPQRQISNKAKHDKRLKQVDYILMQHNNEFISFTDLGKLLGYSSKTRYQNMTHLRKAFELFPDRYEVRSSKLGGKKVRLVKEYLNHILKGGA